MDCVSFQNRVAYMWGVLGEDILSVVTEELFSAEKTREDVESYIMTLEDCQQSMLDAVEALKSLDEALSAAEEDVISAS